jgi:hypothetical protein
MLGTDIFKPLAVNFIARFGASTKIGGKIPRYSPPNPSCLMIEPKVENNDGAAVTESCDRVLIRSRGYIVRISDTPAIAPARRFHWKGRGGGFGGAVVVDIIFVFGCME